MDGTNNGTDNHAEALVGKHLSVASYDDNYDGFDVAMTTVPREESNERTRRRLRTCSELWG